MSVVLFLSFPVETHEIDTDNNERNAQPLSHIQSHTVFKVYLVLGEGDLFFQSPFIQVNHSQEEDKISDCFVKLRRMAGKHIYPFKDESPRHIGGLADDFRIHQVGQTDAARCDRCSHSDHIEHIHVMHLGLAAIEP